MDHNQSSSAIKERSLTISVFGQGKMGLPIDVVFLEAGYNVIGVDTNSKIVDRINSGDIPIIGEPGVKEGLTKGMTGKKYYCTLSVEEAVKSSDIILIIIPIMLDENKNPDLEPLLLTLKNIGEYLEKGHTIIIECTVPITTTNGIIKETLEKVSGLKAGEDFGLGFSPERTFSGRAIADIRDNYPKIVGGINSKSTEKLSMIYNSIAHKGVIELTATEAEAVKIFKGVYGDVNIALANEFAIISEKLNIDVSKIIKASNSEPFSHIHRQGPGVGGHCIPVYPQFLINIAESRNVNALLTKTGRKINLSMPEHVIKRIIYGFEKVGKHLDKSKITLLGLAYRGDVKEHRYSPSIDITNLLKNCNPRELVLSDPLYTAEEVAEIVDVEFEQDLLIASLKADCLVILTDHKEYKESELSKVLDSLNKPFIIVDTKDIIQSTRDLEDGFLIGIGR